jgi:hypothetical protein
MHIQFQQWSGDATRQRRLARARWTYEQLVEKAFTPALGFSCLVFQFAKRGDFVILSEYLKRLDLIKVGTGGRSLTSCGRRYLV